MLATLVDADSWLAADREDWCYERKLDGLRCLAVRNRSQVQLWSRNHNSFDARFPHIRTELATFPSANYTLDGELVAFDGDDFVGFGALQQHGSDLDVIFCVFDVLHLLGRDVRELALTERKHWPVWSSAAATSGESTSSRATRRTFCPAPAAKVGRG